MFPINSDYDDKIKVESDVSALVLEEQPFHVLFLGNWSGATGDKLETADPLKNQCLEVDKDNFDEILAQFNVKLNLTFPGDADSFLPLSFSSLDDFHPDSIFRQIPLFSDLFDLRKRLLSPKSFSLAADEVNSWFRETTGDLSQMIQTSESNPNTETVDNDWLEQLLSRDEEKKSLVNKSVESSELSGFVKKIVKPHLVQIDAGEQSEVLMVIDRVISESMRKILHHPDFQCLEAAWRAVFFFVRRVETNAKLKIFLLDVSKAELATSLNFRKNLDLTQVQKVLTRRDSKHDNSPFWGAICGNYTFTLDVEDTATLIRASEFARSINCPFISYLKPDNFAPFSSDLSDGSADWKFSEDSADDKLWTIIRVSSAAPYLGLAVARVLGRLPYGKNTDPIETFVFEEFVENVSHENYLWLNPSFIIALLMAQTYCEFGWKMPQNLFRQVEGMPIHLYSVNGIDKIKSSVEFDLNEKNHQSLLEEGFIPLLSPKNTDEIRLSHLQSTAFPFSLLKGKWA